ncbi:MAG: hypothetical protein ACD_20C00100G0002 [uncultured bacterium]|nr:MAG: hypothetical protein ACD_20C00100G0002 [uncultured bacterium]HBH18508.1 general secretion pathway protein GspE [Cyanobacteria bacterium UBA9579]
MSVIRNNLYDILLETGIITEDQLKKATIEKERSNKSLIQVICDLNFATKENLYSQLKTALELQYGVNFILLSEIEVDLELLGIFPEELISNNKIIPIKRSGNVFTFAMVDPDNLSAEKEIRYRLSDIKDLKIKKAVILEDDFNIFFEKHFPKKEEASEVIEQNTDELLTSLGVDLIESQIDDFDIADLSDSAQEAPIIQLANSILGVAIKRGVSDIHIEPREKYLVVRYRLDGVLSTYKKLPKKIQNAIISRYKIMAELDISERRLPQDGRIRVKMTNKFIDFRMSTLPGKFGEKIVMRILDKSNISFGLDQLITNQETLKTVREMITRPFGIIFVTGPTGSGKTTTLYSALSERNTPEVNISTAEDPIEYDLDGITQSEVNKSIGMDFAKILKAFLRQDPDIMLVGETRDKETAKIAVEAALTGHLVFTTLHTNDAPSSIIRLQEMGIEPFLISSTIIGIVAQRLLRKLCPHCKEAYTPDVQTLDFLGVGMLENKTYYKGKGCDKCNDTGYKGRIGAYEVMKVNDEIKDLIAKGANTSIIKFAAQQSGMKSLMEYSLELAREGVTTLEEVVRVTLSSDGMSSVCPGCGRPVGDEFYKCPFCQYELKTVCPRCKVITQEGWISCAKCGLKLLDYKADTTCNNCNGEVSLEMYECPWCCQPISANNV